MGNVSKCKVNCKGMHVFYTVQCTVVIKEKRFQVYSKLQRDARFLYCTVYSSNKGGMFPSVYIVNCKRRNEFVKFLTGFETK